MEPELDVYTPSQSADLLLVDWWARMLRDGDLERTFGVGAMTLTAFLQLLGRPRILAYTAVPDEGITFAFLLDPVLGGAFVTVWVAPTHRQSPSVYRNILRCYAEALERFPVVLGVTKQPHLLPEHEKLGYVTVGCIPQIFDGTADGWLVRLTPADFAAATTARHGRSGGLNGIERC